MRADLNRVRTTPTCLLPFPWSEKGVGERRAGHRPVSTCDNRIKGAASSSLRSGGGTLRQVGNIPELEVVKRYTWQYLAGCATIIPNIQGYTPPSSDKVFSEMQRLPVNK